MEQTCAVVDSALVPVAVVARDPMLEAGAASALRACPELVVVEGEAAESARVAVVLVDEVDREVLDLARARRGAVVLVVAELTPVQALHAVLAGVRGLLRRRDADARRLTRAVLAASVGDCTVPPDLLDRLQGAVGAPASPALAGSGLSERERAVLALVAEGRETGEIAKELCYSPRTVTTVVHDITRRFRLRNRAHAVAYALRAGLL
ncbi:MULTISPECIES: response regulator transcription factor [Actinosynnema]|uniref:helix-turn-helix transcriptional regulator n=1 Tax=Actinosynnema TaxID=40566 RepID=UPI0020A28E39|nr:response regulator transcription factor [Actinosynnema pretiosum]MCP2096321.1 DNA-binding response regulator, NarL/FixJ family, contains REC and HTH domains [Actinosynnema pretiosum]